MSRVTERLSKGYKFMLSAPAEAVKSDFDDSAWENVRVPHDWAIHSDFGPEFDASYNSVEADGIHEMIAHSGRTGGLPIVGVGTYRRKLDISKDDEGKNISLEFDGVMWTSDIYINGTKVFHNHFGYKSFTVDITDYVNYGGENLLAVVAEVKHDCSRWYPGAGIFRNVRLVKKNSTYIGYNGIWFRQLDVSPLIASYEFNIEACGDAKTAKVVIEKANGEKAAELTAPIADGKACEMIQIAHPVLWDIDNPYLYNAKVTLLDYEGNETDETSVRLGVRFFKFTTDKGFFLNGRRVPIQGVCNHHDLGSLGAAVNVAALKRQLRIMRDMGVNAIRTSHNPPAPELLNLCDEMGFVVMDEFFDEWLDPKVANGYAQSFKDHASQDVHEIVKRDRNHPCVILWSIGNEIGEQGQKDGWKVAKLLAEATRDADPTRPIGAGFNNPWGAFRNHLADYVDCAGLNYNPQGYKGFHEEHPNVCLIGSETASCISTRGVYKLPAVVDIEAKCQPDLTISAYELSGPGWACYPEREFGALDDNPCVAGEFVWTGFDYLGEPTPYYHDWPSRSSYFGIVDIAGIPKNRFYGYKAKWTNDEVLHIFPHWNWNDGDIVPVHCYTSYPCAELFVNGKSYGKKTFAVCEGDNIARYRLMWDDVKYEPGEIRVVAYDANGYAKAEKVVRTAGEPYAVKLEADRKCIAADGEDLVYVTATVVDKDGNECPLADNRIKFSVTGNAELLTTDSGDERETETFWSDSKKALAGKVVACVRSLETCGSAVITAQSEGLEGSDVAVSVG